MTSSTTFQNYSWHLEISSKCALRCSACQRTLFPHSFKPQELGLDFIQKIFTPEFMKANVQRIVFSGGVGDALYNSQLLEIVDYLKKTSPELNLILMTNGSHRKRDWWESLAKKMNQYDEIVFAVDGWDHDSNNLYRAGSDWKSIMDGMEVMVASPALVIWNTIIFRFNQDKLKVIEEVARDKGVNRFSILCSDRFGENDPLKPDEEFTSQYRVKKYNHWFRDPDPKRKLRRPVQKKIDESEQSLLEHSQASYGSGTIMPGCRFSARGVYIDYEGFFYPCSWASHEFDNYVSPSDPTRSLSFKDSFFFKNRSRFDLKTRSLSEILHDSVWTELESSWTPGNIPNILCEAKCGQGVHFNLQSRPSAQTLLKSTGNL